jgi:hypothetical protein
MARTDVFAETFAALRALLRRHGKKLKVVVDKPGDFQLASSTLRDRTGRPLFVAGIQTKKNYVSFHLIPVYVQPALLDGVSPALRKRMQGKACFNFTTIDGEQLEELGALTREGLKRMETIKLPWATT